jgi:deoxyribodipyrimidine photo-lyase
MQDIKNKTGLIWFKNNLRVQDNKCLNHAIAENNSVIAVYCFDPRDYNTSRFGFKKTEKFRAQFLIETITNLKGNLKTLHIPLFVYLETPETVISQITKVFKIDNLYLQKEWTQEEIDVFKKVKEQLTDVHITSFYDQFLYHPEDIPFEIPSIPKVFTEFRKKTEKFTRVRQYLKVDKTLNQQIENNTIIPNLKDLGFENFHSHSNSAFPFKGGEDEALNRLYDYFFESKKLGFYKKTRNGLIGTDFSSKFSPWLANGSISAKTIYWNVKTFEKNHIKNDSTYWLIFELIWRDYFKYISLKHGNNIFKIGGILNKQYQWNTNVPLIEKWIEGKTDEPFVNANMIELKKTGWMSNRGRQNVASYFAKNLKLDWRIGASYFESMLIDYDVHSNYGNWMYVSGVGNDPRDRKFNIKLQAERYDTNNAFQNLWLQETLFK